MLAITTIHYIRRYNLVSDIPQPDAPASASHPPHPLAGHHDTWTCSVCGGYVRADATLCKHCHIPFQNEVQIAAAKTQTQQEWMSILVLAAAGLLGWWMGQLLPGLQGVAFGWTVAVSVLWVAICSSQAMRALIRTHTSTRWAILVGLWLFLFVGIALPATLYTWIEDVAGWVGLPLGFAVAITLFLLVVFATVQIVGPRRPDLLHHYGEQRSWGKWHTVRNIWLQILVVYILPLTLVAWIKVTWGRDVGEIAQILWLFWVTYGGTRVVAWFKQQYHLK
jgi:hypothetical protein